MPRTAPARLFAPLLLAAAAAAGTSVPAQQKQWNAVSAIPALGHPEPAVAEMLTTMGRELGEVEQATVDTLPSLAWFGLAGNANGSSLRSGPLVAPLRQCTATLRTLLDAGGGERPMLHQISRADAALCSFAFAQNCVSSDYKLLHKTVRTCCEAVIERFTETEAPPANAEELALLAMTTRALAELRAFEQERDELLAIVVEGAAALPRGEQRFPDAVRHYVELLRHRLGDQDPATRPAPELTVAMCWPADPLANPLHAWLGAFAVRDLPTRFLRQQRTAAQQLLAARGAHGRWPTRDGEHPMRKAAMLAGVLGMTAPPAQPESGEPDAPGKRGGDPWDEAIK